jgi:hypothetical protein
VGFVSVTLNIVNKTLMAFIYFTAVRVFGLETAAHMSVEKLKQKTIGRFGTLAAFYADMIWVSGPQTDR